MNLSVNLHDTKVFLGMLVTQIRNPLYKCISPVDLLVTMTSCSILVKEKITLKMLPVVSVYYNYI